MNAQLQKEIARAVLSVLCKHNVSPITGIECLMGAACDILAAAAKILKENEKEFIVKHLELSIKQINEQL